MREGEGGEEEMRARISWRKIIVAYSRRRENDWEDAN